MQFTVRSLGGKLIIGAMLVFLLCLLLFTLLSWALFRSYSEYQARREAQTHLALLHTSYQAHMTELIHDLAGISHDSHVVAMLTHTPTSDDTAYLQKLLVTYAVRDHISALNVVSTDKHELVAQGEPGASLSAETLHLVDQAARGKPAVALHPGTSLRTQPPVFDIALPLVSTGGVVRGVLEAVQPVDSYFIQLLTQQTGVNSILCASGHIIGTKNVNGPTPNSMQNLSEQQICTPGQSRLLSYPQSSLLLVASMSINEQARDSLPLVVATVEPLISANSFTPRVLLIVAGVGIFVFALGVILYAFITSVLLIRPLRRLQANAQALVASNTGVQIGLPLTNELHMLASSFHLLVESLYSESQALTDQMSNLLILSDALMSTINLEHLLAEIVTQTGHILHVKHVTLLLYGREMPSPWAVAHWPGIAEKTSDQEDPARVQGAATVYTDPDGDITLAATTKMAAIPGPHAKTASAKRRALRGANSPRTSSGDSSSGRHRIRIPRQVLRDLDMILARMAIHRQKIVYGEDIHTIYQERKELWALMALDMGYRSAISVPLLLSDQPIGAFILYTGEPHPISSRDTFLLTTTALQTAMAIENALLFAEVKEKNTALERANHLKSQFLANVTHELRTPLHSIISYGALILEGFVEGSLTTEQEEHIQFMVHRAEDLSHLVDDMLDLSKIEADRIEVKPEPLELLSCLTEVVNQLKPLANNKDLYLRLEIEKALPVALADSHRLRQIVLNLVSNALKFTEKGGVTIRCKYLKQNDMLHISVNDTGIGISPAAIGYIFEAFRQADGSTTRRFGGTGLGLTIAKRLIELQEGEITVESMPGEGSTFAFTLPIALS
jgi:signal transduction histidine kinase